MDTRRGPVSGLALLLVAGGLVAACGGSGGGGVARSASPTAAEESSPEPQATSPDTFAACNGAGPQILAPDDGAVVSGTVTIVAQLLEDPCFIAASTFVTVFDEGGEVVHRSCDNGLPAEVRWDTLGAVNGGSYLIRAQRGCGCRTACPELGEPIRVHVQN